MGEGDGNGWVKLADGSYRWGRFGASGLLLHAAGEDGRTRVLLQHRAAWSHQGGTWGLPGGAMDSEETSVAAALREFGEEVAGDLGDIDVTGIFRADAGTWHYDTVLAAADAQRPFSAGNAESEEIRWVAADEVPQLVLVPAFGEAWPLLAAALPARLRVAVDAAAVLGGEPAPDAAADLRDALARIASDGIAGGAVPDPAALPELHLWYPRFRLFTDAPIGPAPGVEVARAGAEAPAPWLRVSQDWLAAAGLSGLLRCV
ncbi:NUDIX domain-containing protein [Nocardiopsis coralliicola]